MEMKKSLPTMTTQAKTRPGTPEQICFLLTLQPPMCKNKFNFKKKPGTEPVTGKKAKYIVNY